jgi:putative ABC transport system permease protein
MSFLPPQTGARRRSSGRRTSMFLRMLMRAAVLRRGRAAAALVALVVAAAVATAVLNLYVDVQDKLSREFRNYGANGVILGKNDQALPPDTLAKVNRTLGGRGLAVPFAYVVARTSDGQSLVAGGTDLTRVRKLDSWWSVTGWPTAAKDALVGVRAGRVVSPQGGPFELRFRGRTIRLQTAGMLRTGAAEDSRVYLSAEDFAAWTGVQPSTIEVAISGSAEEVNALIRQLAAALPGAEVRPVRQIMEGEARVLGKTRATLYASSALIILTAGLCVLSTLVGWVYDRRRDFAIMKALGASGRVIHGFFAAEAAALGAVGALFGFSIGIAVAAWIGRANFHAAVTPRFSLLPGIVAGSMAVALISAILPMALLEKVQPATILRGE